MVITFTLRDMQAGGINVHASTLVCDCCGASNKKVLQHEYVCMTCGVVDAGAMIIDEMSENRKQWENSESDTHANLNKHVTSSKTKHSGICVRRDSGDEQARKAKHVKAFSIAKRVACVFSVETDQIPSEAVCLYMATREETCTHVLMADVVACTLIVAHRRTSRDIEDVALALTVKQKSVTSAIECIQAKVLMGSKDIGAAYAYLFCNVGERRPNKLIAEAMDRLIEISSVDDRHSVFRSSWGVRSLAEDMMKHIHACRLIGGESLQLLARALVIMSCELYQLRVTVHASFIRGSLMVVHRATWAAALESWSTNLGSFEAHVSRKRSMREYGVNDIGSNRDGRTNLVHTESPHVHNAFSENRARLLADSKDIRVKVSRLFASVSRFMQHKDSSISAGVTHLCIFTVLHNGAVRNFLISNPLDGVDMLLDVCLAAVQNRQPECYVPHTLVSLITGTTGFSYTVRLSRNFKNPSLPQKGCFLRVALQHAV